MPEVSLGGPLLVIQTFEYPKPCEIMINVRSFILKKYSRWVSGPRTTCSRNSDLLVFIVFIMTLNHHKPSMLICILLLKSYLLFNPFPSFSVLFHPFSSLRQTAEFRAELQFSVLHSQTFPSSPRCRSDVAASKVWLKSLMLPLASIKQPNVWVKTQYMCMCISII